VVGGEKVVLVGRMLVFGIANSTVRAHPTSQFSQQATPTRSDNKKDEVIEPPTIAIIVRFFGVLIH
jgi:hypothetical protein